MNKWLTRSIAIGVIAGSLLAAPQAATAAPQLEPSKTTSATATTAATTYRWVCAPRKCVYVASYQYKPVGTTGGGHYRYQRYYGPCSQSWGCFTINGLNYIAINGPRPTAAQQNAISQCAIGLGLTVASAASGGTLGWTMIGVGMLVWGCASI